MQRVALASLVALTLAFVAGPAMAQQPAPTAPPGGPMQPMPAPGSPPEENCPRLIAQIVRETNIRFDPTAANAKVAAAQATKMQADKNYTACVKTTEDALASLGIKK